MSELTDIDGSLKYIIIQSESQKRYDEKSIAADGNGIEKNFEIFIY